jgi:hypothetical protein
MEPVASAAPWSFMRRQHLISGSGCNVVEQAITAHMNKGIIHSNLYCLSFHGWKR